MTTPSDERIMEKWDKFAIWHPRSKKFIVTEVAFLLAVRELFEQAEWMEEQVKSLRESEKQYKELIDLARLQCQIYRKHLPEDLAKELDFEGVTKAGPEYIGRIAELEARLSAQQPEPWVSVKERLPKEDGLYWTYRSNGSRRVLRADTNRSEWNDEVTDFYVCDFDEVTHWMEYLPAPPTGKE